LHVEDAEDTYHTHTLTHSTVRPNGPKYVIFLSLREKLFASLCGTRCVCARRAAHEQSVPLRSGLLHSSIAHRRVSERARERMLQERERSSRSFVLVFGICERRAKGH
jgi:hypothetical protein